MSEQGTKESRAHPKRQQVATCKYCGEKFKALRPNQILCNNPLCYDEHSAEIRKKNNERYRKRRKT